MLSKLSDAFQKKIFWESPGRALEIYRRVPPWMLQRLRVHNLRHTLKLTGEKSIFYSRLFEKNPFDIQTIKSIEDLYFMYTSQSDLSGNAPNDFLCNRPDTAYETTGTTSKSPKRVFFSYRELEDAGRIGAAGLWGLGLRPSDRVVSSFDYSFWVSGPALQAALKIMGVFHLEAGRISPDEFYERIRPYRANVIVADPGWLLRLAEVAEKKGPWTMKFMLAGGENLAESSRRYIESVWQSKVYLSYGQTEAFGMIGLECTKQRGYHINDMDLWPEVPMADTDGYGELIYTTLRRSVMPLVRYRSGDITKIIPEPCDCGMRSVRIEKLHGRADEMAVTSVGNVAPWMFENVITEMKARISDWQVALKQENRRDIIIFRAEISGVPNEGRFRDEFLLAMKVHMPVAYQGIMNRLAEFKLEIFPPEGLRTRRKVKRLLDERDFRFIGSQSGEENTGREQTTTLN